VREREVMSKRGLVAIGGVALVVFVIWMRWYSSPEQKLQRCIGAERKDYYSTSQTQNAHNESDEARFVVDCKKKLGMKL
jgi:hypothetical protein